MFRVGLRHSNGTTVVAEIQASPLRQDGEVVGRVGVGRLIDSDNTSAQDVQRTIAEDRARIARSLIPLIEGVVLDTKSAARSDYGEDSSEIEIFRRHGLGDTDIAILRFITEGASNAEIGKRVNLSAAAVKDRVARLMRRFGVNRRAELSAQALRAGLA